MEKQEGTQLSEPAQPTPGLSSNAAYLKGKPQDHLSQTHRSPLWLFLTVIAGIFLAEVVAMNVVQALKPMPYYQVTLIDAGIMTVLIFPVLYLLTFRPLLRHIDERLQAEEALLRSRDLQENFFDSIDTLIAYMDRDFNFIRVNDAYARACGSPIEHFRGKNHFALFPNAENEEIFRRVVETGHGYIVHEKPFEYPDQPERGITYWNWSLQPVKAPDETVEGLVLSLVDVTERKRAQDALRRAYDELEQRVEERTEKLRILNTDLEDEVNTRKRAEEALQQSQLGLKQAQAISHLGSWELDLVQNRLTWSDEVYRIFALDPEQCSVSYEAFLESVHPDDRTMVDDAYSNSVRHGKDGYEIEHRIVRRSTGEIRIVHEKCEHFRNEAGQVVRSVGMVHDITERKQAEESRRRSEALLLQTGRMARVGGWELNMQSMELYWSPETYSIHEVEPVFQPNLESAIDFYAPEARPIINSAVQRSIQDGVPYDLELPFVTAKGNPIWIRTIGQSDFVDGRCMRLVGTFQDITQRKQAEKALQVAREELELRVQERTEQLAIANRELLKEIAERAEIERRLRTQTTAMDAAANGIVITDRHGIIQWTNPALLQITGYEACDLLGHSMQIFKSGEHDAGYYRKMWNTILSGEVWRGEITNRRKDGSLYVEDQTITPVRDEQGQVTQFIAIKQDVTERKRSEEALRASEEKFRTLVEWTYDWETWLDPHGRIVYTSPSCARITGYGPDEFKMNPDLMLSIIHPDDRALYQEHQRLLHSDSAGVKNIEYRIMSRDGRQYWIGHVCRPLFDADNRYLGRRMSNRDITEQKQVERDIQDRNLKEKILTQTIHTMQLDIARDLHDTLGQNISFLRMTLDHLAEKKIRKPAQLQLEIQNMARAANESYDLMRGTLAVLQSENSSDLFRLFTRYAEQIEDRSAFRIQFSGRGEPRFMSARRMRQLFYIFREILNNIEKHSNATEVSIEMAWDQDCLRLVVFDNGSGFDPQHIQYGNHYGLRFMRERAELLNGSLVIQAAPGSGTNILLTVPYE